MYIIISIIVFCGIMRANRLMREARDGHHDSVVWDEDKHTQYIFYGDGDCDGD